MRTANLDSVSTYTKDETVFGSRDFRDSANNLWRDNLNFNIFDSSGYLTEDAKNHIRENNIDKKDGETWGDAILRHAEWFELGYQCDKAPKKRSDVKFSGSMILNSFLVAEEQGRDYRPSSENTYSSNDLDGYTDGIDLIELYTEDSYNSKRKTSKGPVNAREYNSIEEMNAAHREILNRL